ncbi:hypothetical protein [Nocardiopsis alba]
MPDLPDLPDDLFGLLSAIVLILVGASIKPLTSWIDDTRKRRYERKDHERQQKQSQRETKRAQLTQIIDQYAEIGEAMSRRIEGWDSFNPYEEARNLQYSAIKFGDQEIIDAVAKFHAGGPGDEFLLLVTRKIQALDDPAPVKGWRRLFIKNRQTP